MIAALLIGAGAIAAGTLMGASLPALVMVGALIGWRARARPAATAALAGIAGWGALLLAGQLRGEAMGAVARMVGGAVGLPAWAFVAATLLYAAILAASTAALVSVRRVGAPPGPTDAARAGGGAA